MPRKVRIEYAGACYHAINRGNYRRDLFARQGAAESFQACLLEATARFGWRLNAFVVMRNHFHLAVETPEPNLSEGMKWLQGTWAARFNRHRGETGRPFQGRYKALHVEPGHALAQVCHYIHLNPVRAKTVTAARLLEHRWGSLPLFVAKTRPACLEPATVLAESGNLTDSSAGWRRYLAYLDLLAEEDNRRREEKFGRLSRGWMVGTETFKAELKQKLAAQTAPAADHGRSPRTQVALLGADREAHREARAELWETQLIALARRAHIDLKKLPAPKSHPSKALLAAAMKRSTSVSNAWLAERLAMGRPASASQFARRWMLREEGREAVERLLAAR